MKQKTIFLQSVMSIKEIFLIALGLACMLGLLYSAPFLNNFWMYDDPLILRFSAEHPFWAWFFHPETWKLLSSAHFTPMAVLSYALDHALFGLAPHWFYLHSLTSLWVLSILLYAILRRYIHLWAALLGVTFFVLSKPFAAAAELLMLRHYIEGAVFSCLSLIFFISALRQDSNYKTAWAALFYLLAMLSKEVYIPLALLLCLIPEATFGQRLKKGLFLVPALGFYFLWRYWMLGSFVGGFAGTILAEGKQNLSLVLLQNLQYLASTIAAWEGLGSLVCILLGALLLASLGWEHYQRNYSLLLFVLLGLAGVMLPLLPISQYLGTELVMDFRFAFAATPFFSALLALAAAHPPLIWAGFKKNVPAWTAQRRPLIKKIWTGLFICALLGMGLDSQLWIMEKRASEIAPLSLEGDFFWQNDQSDILVRSSFLLSTHYYQHLAYFLQQEKNGRPPIVIAAEYGFLSDLNKKTSNQPRFYAYTKTGQITDVSYEARQKRQVLLSRLASHQFTLNLQVQQGSFALQLESLAAENGRFFLLMGYRPGIYCDVFGFAPQRAIDIKGNFLSGLQAYIRFGWEAEDGTISLSPQWRVDFAQNTTIKWPQ